VLFKRTVHPKACHHRLSHSFSKLSLLSWNTKEEVLQNIQTALSHSTKV